MKRILAMLMLLNLPAMADSRIRTELYADDDIYQVRGRTGFESAIQFGAEEKIENVAVGDSLSWQVTPNKRANLLFVKPVTAGARTNMTVVTDQHVYLFDLVTAPKLALYELRFDYPQKPLDAVKPALRPEKPESAVPPIAIKWSMQGDRKLFPAHVRDDGKTVTLGWPKEAAIPAILVPGPDGSEGPVNFTVQDGDIAIANAPRKLVLRAGGARAVLTAAPVRTAQNMQER